MKTERSYHNKWGYGLKEILRMPRQQFSNMFGARFLDMSDSKFKRVIIRETPFVVRGNGSMARFIPDTLANPKLYKSTQRGVWDLVSTII